MDHKRPSYDGFLTKQNDPLAFKADAEKGVATGYASLFWVVDSYAEATAPGAFAKSIADRGPKAGKPRLLTRYEHEYTVGSHTAAAEDATGPLVDLQISDDGMYGTAVRRQLADSVPYGLSIGFRRIASRPATIEDPLDLTSAPAWVRQMAIDDVSQITVLTDLKWLETSVVSFPAVDPAAVESYRSDDLNARALDRVLADLKAGRLTEAHLTTIRQIAAALPADVAPEGRQADPTTRAADGSTPLIRNRIAEARLALAAAGLSWESITP